MGRLGWNTLSLLVLVAGLYGCADDNSRSGPTGAELTPTFYPLQIGNAWSYEYTSDVRFFNADSGALLKRNTNTGLGDVTLDRSEEIGGVSYTTETTVFTPTGGQPNTTWVRLRQDDAGLFRADISNTIPPDSVETSVPPRELTRLRYPLATGSQWTLFPGPPEITATVESFDTLSTPGGTFTAYRVRIDTSNQGSNDWHFVWYGRCGRIRVAQHSELIAVDPGTDDRVRIVNDETQLILDAMLVESRDCDGAE